jgi:hypothetical protein
VKAGFLSAGVKSQDVVHFVGKAEAGLVMREERSRIAGGGADAEVDADVEAERLEAWYRYNVGESFVVWIRRSVGLT